MRPKLILSLALILVVNSQAAIVYPKAPDGGRQIVYQNLNPKFLGVSRIEDLTIAEPYRCYYVEVSNLASGQLLSVAKSGGWQYRLMRGSNVVGAVDLVADEKNRKALVFAGLYESDFSREVLASQTAGQWPQTKKQDYELRRLDIPGINSWRSGFMGSRTTSSCRCPHLWTKTDCLRKLFRESDSQSPDGGGKRSNEGATLISLKLRQIHCLRSVGRERV